jgi:magnesium-protoporphyrin O-methyltransferase
MTYDATRDRLEHYFDRTAAKTWERLTSDAPVSRIRETVRAGRDLMRAALLAELPADLTGLRILDAGAGAGQMAEELARRGARVVAVDISPALLAVARKRIPESLHARIEFRTGDMLDPALGRFDGVVAMDSLIHYNAADIAQALARLSERCGGTIRFTIAPRTALLTLFWGLGQLFPKSDRSPAIAPHSPAALRRALARAGARGTLAEGARISSGFYISQAMELRP